MEMAENNIPGDNEHEDDAGQTGNCIVVCACPRRQLVILSAIGVVILVVVATVGGVLGARASSPEGNSGEGAPTPSGVPNMTAPLAVPVAMSPTDSPTFLPPSRSFPTTPPFTPVPTPDPIQNAGPMPTTTPPTGSPVVSSPTVFSPTMDAIRNDRGMLRCGFYDYTVTGDDNESYEGFSIDLVR
jgi:hypothetical protein